MTETTEPKSRKQRLMQSVMEYAACLPKWQGLVADDEKAVETGVLRGQTFVVPTLHGAKVSGVVTDDALRLDPELHRLHLMRLDCRLALHRANVQIAEYCSDKLKYLGEGR